MGVIFENIEFCIFGIVGTVGAGRGIARCRNEAVFEYVLVILKPYSSEGILFCLSFSERISGISDAVWRRYYLVVIVGNGVFLGCHSTVSASHTPLVDRM